MDGQVRIQSKDAGWRSKLGYWLSGGLIQDPRSAMYILGTLAAVGLFMVFYISQFIAARAAIEESIPAGGIHRLLHADAAAFGAAAKN